MGRPIVRMFAAILVGFALMFGAGVAQAKGPAFCQYGFASEVVKNLKAQNPDAKSVVLTKDEALRLMKEYNALPGIKQLDFDAASFFVKGLQAFVVFSKDGCVIGAGSINVLALLKVHPWLSDVFKRLK